MFCWNRFIKTRIFVCLIYQRLPLFLVPTPPPDGGTADTSEYDKILFMVVSHFNKCLFPPFNLPSSCLSTLRHHHFNLPLDKLNFYVRVIMRSETISSRISLTNQENKFSLTFECVLYLFRHTKDWRSTDQQRFESNLLANSRLVHCSDSWLRLARERERPTAKWDTHIIVTLKWR